MIFCHIDASVDTVIYTSRFSKVRKTVEIEINYQMSFTVSVVTSYASIFKT